MCAGTCIYKTVVGQLGLNLVEIILLVRGEAASPDRNGPKFIHPKFMPSTTEVFG